jgi:hypothetical protein
MSQCSEIIQRRLLCAVGCPYFQRSPWPESVIGMSGFSDRHGPESMIGMGRIQ